MAIRVKKLARELKGSPDQILALLRELGYDKYSSPNDMIPDRPASLARELVRKSGLPAPSKVRAAPAKKPAPKPKKPTPPVRRDDLMARLVGGVSPSESRKAAAEGLDLPIEALAVSGRGAPIDDALSEVGAAVKAEEQRLQARARDLAKRSRELEDERASLQAERDALLAERDALRGEIEASREQLASRAAALDAIEAGGVPVSALLERRGLRGADEQARALAALARARLLTPLVDRLRVIDPGPVQALLRDRLVLTSGPVAELEGLAQVQVAEERAEVPGGDALDRVRYDIGGELLLSGLKRVRLVGGTAVDIRLLRGGVDPRIELVVVSARRRDVEQVADDVSDVDVVILWDVEETEAARQAYDAADVVVVRVAGSGLMGLRAGLRDGLALD